MAARILAQVLVLGSGILARGVAQAYRQALQSKAELTVAIQQHQYHIHQNLNQTVEVHATTSDASTTGVAQETLQNAVRRGAKAMTEQEARQILGVSERSSWDEVAQKYDTLFERNDTSGSFYLQSKVHRAKECLETVYHPKD